MRTHELLAGLGLPETDLYEAKRRGVELDYDVIAAHPKQAVHFNLFAEGWEKREGAAR